MSIRKQFLTFCEDLKSPTVDVDKILYKYWFSWCCPKEEIIPRSKRIANQISWLIKSPSIEEEYYFELNNTINGQDEYYDEVSIINKNNENVYVLSFNYGFEKNEKIELWSQKNNYDCPVSVGSIKNIQKYLVSACN